MSEHMETLGMRALSLDNAGDNGEKDLGVPKDADNNDDEEPGQICMYACVLFIMRWQCQSAGSSPINAGAIPSATDAGTTTADPREILKVGRKRQTAS